MNNTNTLPIETAFERPVIKDPGSSLTHFAGLVMALVGTAPLIMKASLHGSFLAPFSMGIFMLSMIFLYAASTTYHTFDVSPKVNRILKKIDHCMISILIAGSYTPVCLLVLKTRGILVLTIVWLLAITGIVIKLYWINCPKWFSSVLYIGMGWTCLLALPQIISSLQGPAFSWLLTGGIFYTIGGIVYAMKLQIFNTRHPYFGSHEIFHLFVCAGSLCHYIFMYCYIA